MKVVKVRRVGNSNVISIPREFEATVPRVPRCSWRSFRVAIKRTALIAMLVFLEIDSWRVEASEPELADWILSFSRGATLEAVAELVSAAMCPIWCCDGLPNGGAASWGTAEDRNLRSQPR
jgi:hypothetical protein